MTHQEGKSSLLSGSYVITLTVEIDKLIEKDYDQKTTTVSRPKQKFEIVITPISDEQSNQTQTENSDTENSDTEVETDSEQDCDQESQSSTSPEKSSSNMDLETAIESAVLSELRSNYTLK